MPQRPLAPWFLAAALASCTASPDPLANSADSTITDSAVTAEAALADTTAPETADATAKLPPSKWLESLDACWTDLSCKRAFVLSHGGDWTIGEGRPYDSKAAFQRALDLGADGIKTDFLVTKDNVAVVAHSSPIEFWESKECEGQKIEEMTAAQVTACHLFDLPEDLTPTQTYQRVDDVIEWARGKTTLMLTVKDSSAFAPAIALILAKKAEQFVHIETHFGNLALIQTLPNWAKVRYTVQIGSLSEVQAVAKLPPVLFCEMNPSYPELDAAGLQQWIAGHVHAAGMRAFVSSQKLPSVDQHKALWAAGFDVIMSYNLANAIQARTETNAARGVSPP